MKLSVKECLSFGWTTFKKRPWIFVKAALLVAGVSLAFNIINGAIDLGVRTTTSSFAIILFTTALVILTIVSVYVSIVLNNMGFTKFYLKAQDNVTTLTVRDLWVPNPFITYVLTSVLYGIMFFFGILLFVIPGIFVSLVFGMALYVVMDHGSKPMEALKESMRITRGNRWKLFLLGVAIIGINLAGILVLIVGLFVTIPVTTLASVHAYRVLSNAQELPAVA